MKPGGFVLDLLKGSPDTGRTILFLRHSIRDSFKGVPDHVRPHVEITPEGVRAAHEFGESLSRIVPGRDLYLMHTIARRCRMTAECIGQGYSPSHHFPLEVCPVEVGDPVVNLGGFVERRQELGWHLLIRKWLGNGIPDTILQEPGRFSDTLISRLVSHPRVEDGGLFVAIGHDVTLFPVISHVFGRELTTIDFLNGIVISVEGTTAGIRFADSECSLKRKLDLDEIMPSDRVPEHGRLG